MRNPAIGIVRPQLRHIGVQGKDLRAAEMSMEGCTSREKSETEDGAAMGNGWQMEDRHMY